MLAPALARRCGSKPDAQAAIAPSVEGLGADGIVGVVVDNQSGRDGADGPLWAPGTQVTSVLVERLTSYVSVFFDPRGVATQGDMFRDRLLPGGGRV